MTHRIYDSTFPLPFFSALLRPRYSSIFELFRFLARHHVYSSIFPLPFFSVSFHSRGSSLSVSLLFYTFPLFVCDPPFPRLWLCPIARRETNPELQFPRDLSRRRRRSAPSPQPRRSGRQRGITRTIYNWRPGRNTRPWDYDFWLCEQLLTSLHG